MSSATQHDSIISSDLLAAFLHVADTGSVSQAAIELGVGKSVISKRIALLEHKLQATLFSRSTRKVALTPAGDAYIEYARRALEEIAAGIERLRSMRSELSGRIRLTAPVSWGQHVLSKQLPEFLRLHPGIEIELQLADRRLELARERIDIALRWSTTPSPELACVPVAQIGWKLAASPSYLKTAGKPTTPPELAQHSCLCYWRENSDDSWLLVSQRSVPEPAEECIEVKVNSRYHVDNPDAVLNAAIAGMGIALLPDYVCEDALASEQLVPVLEGWEPRTKFGTQIIAMATPERLTLSRNRTFLEFIRSSSGALTASGIPRPGHPR